MLGGFTSGRRRSGRVIAFLVTSSLASIGCTQESIAPHEAPTATPSDACVAPSPDDPTTFTECPRGGGIFGTWVTDDAGLPAYEYTLDQRVDERAAYFTTEHEEPRTHWGAFGNRRLNAWMTNDGYVEVTTMDRGVEYLDKFDDANGQWGGGYSYVDDGEATWSTAYRWMPSGAKATRRFGMGYGEAITTNRGVEVARRTFAPEGREPFVVDEVTLTNHSSKPKTLDHYEVWDVARRPIETSWLVSGDPLSSVPPETRRERDETNALFDEGVTFDATMQRLTLHRALAAGVAAPPMDGPSVRDFYPGDPFLQALVGPVSDTYTMNAGFFGERGPANPVAVTTRADGEGVTTGARGEALSGRGQPRVFVMKSHVALEPGEARTLRFAFGYSPHGEVVDPSDELRDPAFDALAEYRAALRSRLMYFVGGTEPAVQRELAWHAYQLEASVGERSYFGGPVVPQGSAYLYLHGADGAARDLGLFTLPLVYTDAALAKAELSLYMRIQFAADRRFTYAFQGHGILDDALGFHHAPSDLDLFFLYALSEYVGATGDVAFLDRKVPFYPREAEPDARVWDHLVGATRHLFDDVGTGPHGLVRVGTGDWSDGIVVEAPNRDLAIAEGESVPNTEMAIAILPRVADLIRGRDPELASEINARVDGYRAALPSAWGGAFYGRAYFGDDKLLRGDAVDLEAQVWALIGDEFDSDAERTSTLDAVHTQLDMPSPAGATLQPNGMVWPAVSALLTDGYARTRPDRAWSHFARNTMVAHARAYPDVWFGIWSGPDGLNGPAGDRPGGTWYSAATPMTDFPVQNNNQHAMPLYAALRVAGISARADGIRVAPNAPARTLTMRTELVDLDVRPRGDADGTAIDVHYRPFGDVVRTVRIAAPLGEAIDSADAAGAPIDVHAGDTFVDVAIRGGLGTSTPLHVRTRSTASP